LGEAGAKDPGAKTEAEKKLDTIRRTPDLNSAYSIENIMDQLRAIQNREGKNIVVLGTRYCKRMHQQIIELLSYALVLSDNHIFTSGAVGTHAAVIRGALRAKKPKFLTVVLPQTAEEQPEETRALLVSVENVVELKHTDKSLAEAAKLCNAELISKADQLIVFAFHNSDTLEKTIKQAESMDVLTTVLYLD
jgi:hypothetical protein